MARSKRSTAAPALIAGNEDDQEVDLDVSDEEGKQVHVGNFDNGDGEIEIAKPETYESRNSVDQPTGPIMQSMVA